MSRIALAISLAATLLVASKVAATEESDKANHERCQSALLAPLIRKMVNRTSAVPSPLIAQDAGLPQNNLIHFAPQSSNKNIELPSDLGPSLWSQQELRDWLSLEPFLRDTGQARNLLQNVGKDASVCPAGVLPLLCKHLRQSRNLRIVAIASPDYRAMNDPNNEDLHASARFASQLKISHQSRNLLQFSWGTDGNFSPADLSPRQAREILRTFARETLIRHLLFNGLDGLPHSGAELALETRLMLARAPTLIPLLPFFQVFPLDLPEDFVFGSPLDEDFVQLIDFNLPLEPRSLFPTLKIHVDSQQPGLNAVLAEVEISSDPDNLPLPGDRAQLALRISETLKRLALQFKSEMGLKQAVSVSVIDDEMLPLFTLQISGLGQMNRVLFYYYLVEKLRTSSP